MRTVISRSVKDTWKLADEFARTLKKGDVVGLTGELGGGKTTFIQGLASALKVPEKCYVSSPTFTILKVYPGKMDIFHFDFYRLNSGGELEDLGFDDYVGGEGVCVIEWADKFPELLPEGTKMVGFKVVDEDTREITLDI